MAQEANVSFPSPAGRSSKMLHPADLPPGWSQGRSTCVDVVGASPFARSPGGSVVGLGALSQAVTKKIRKHGEACSKHGFSFLPFAFDTFGGFSMEATYLLGKLQRSLSPRMNTGILSCYDKSRVSLVLLFSEACLNSWLPDGHLMFQAGRYLVEPFLYFLFLLHSCLRYIHKAWYFPKTFNYILQIF